MKIISLLFRANDRWLPFLFRVARFFGARIYIHLEDEEDDETASKTHAEIMQEKLTTLIEKGEADFKEGKGKSFTIEELYAKTNEHA